MDRSPPPVIRRSPVPPDECNLARSFDVIGDRWTLLILRAAMFGVRRFEDFRAELDVPRSILSRRLADLVEHGLMEKREYKEPGQRVRFEYPLTAMGTDLRVPFLAMTEWGTRWVGRGGRGGVVVKSATNDERVRVALVDEHDRVVDPRALRTEVRPLR